MARAQIKSVPRNKSLASGGPLDGAAMKTADPELMRAINRYHIMDAIRRLGPISRVEISAQTDLSPTTVSAITASLLEDGLIVPRQVAPTPDQVRGRPRIMLELNPEAAS